MKRKRVGEKNNKKRRKIKKFNKNDALKNITEEEDIRQYGKYKSHFFTPDQIKFIFGKNTKNKKFIAKLLKTYIIDIAIEAKKKKITCNQVVKLRKDKLLL